MGAVRELVGDVKPADTTAAIEVSGLRMAYGSVEVLRGVDFAVAPGEVIALLGPNGAGKTTTIEILEGFRVPAAGTVRVLGVTPAGGDERWRARVGVVLQSWRDHGRWQVRELLHHLGRYYEPYARAGRPPFDTDELIEAVGLAEHAGKRVKRLSGGRRRRLDVAIGIVGRPEVLFLDEPTAGFDPQARRDFHDLVHRLSDLDDTTIMLTTHDLDKAEKLADRILILAGGKIAVSGIFYPISAMAGWVQVIAQAFPFYWLGLGMRSAFLPDAAAALEIGGSWRPVETLLVLGAWIVAGLLLAPPILRRMARRESGSLMQLRRDRAMQRIG